MSKKKIISLNHTFSGPNMLSSVEMHIIWKRGQHKNTLYEYLYLQKKRRCFYHKKESASSRVPVSSSFHSFQRNDHWIRLKSVANDIYGALIGHYVKESTRVSFFLFASLDTFWAEALFCQILLR